VRKHNIVRRFGTSNLHWQQHAFGICRFYAIPKRVQEAFLLGELTKAPEKVKPRPVEDDFAVDDDDTSVVLDPIAHTEIVDPYADEEFLDDLLVRSPDELESCNPAAVKGG
jgi:hypothetical protein